MKKHLFFISLIIAALLPLSCDKNKDNDDASSHSGESILQILKDKGNYNLFIEAIEKSGYDRLVGGGGLVTVFAPDDAAFSEFLGKEYSTDDVSGIPQEELTTLIGYHIVQFAYEPDDFLAFSQSSEDREKSGGDGTSYKYKTYGKAPVELFTDPLTGRKVNLYSREKFLPIISSRLFKNKGISDPEKDYKSFFPDVDWRGDDDKLYSCDAAVVETGIQAANGFLYTVDKVLRPYPTIYKKLEKEEMSKYSIIKEMIDRTNTYAYDAALTRNYSTTGDSLYLFYHWTAPSKAAEIPELASEWTYHNENGVVFVNDTKYTNLCFFPEDDVLEPYLKEYFKDLGTYEAKNFLDVIPDNAIYHFLKSHIYGAQEIMFPSELDRTVISGPNGEKYSVSSDEVEPHFCANGIIYGTKTVFEPAVFNHLTATLFKEPDFTFYSRAFNIKNMYQQTVDDNNRFTLFVQDDDDMNSQGYISGLSTSARGSYTFKRNSRNMSETAVSELVMSEFLYGEVPDLAEVETQRYFVAKDAKTYFYIKDRALYDARDEEMPIRRIIDCPNGKVIQTGRPIPSRSGAFAVTGSKTEFTRFRQLLIKAGIGNSNGGLINSMAGMTDAIVFLPVNEAVVRATNEGYIPSDVDTLRMYLKYYFVQLKKNKLENFLLPGLGPDGMTSSSFSGDFITMSDYTVEDDIKYMTIGWDPEESTHMTITDMAGKSIDTVDGRVELRTNSAIFPIETCFDYKDIFYNSSSKGSGQEN